MNGKNVDDSKSVNMDSIVPYTCIFIDADWHDYVEATTNCLKCGSDRDKVIENIKSFWINDGNRNNVLPCLSVRSGLDLYLKAMNFPAGSEVIMSAINIPDMVTVVKHHNLKVVPLDVSIETTEPKVELLPRLVTDKTVAILVAHVFGKWCDMDPVIKAAQEYGLVVIEDCAEAFCGFERLGDPRSDLALFSFGVIKYFTAFGGAIAKVKDDSVFSKMMGLYDGYEMQTRWEYFKKTCKCLTVYLALACPCVSQSIMYLCRCCNLDHKLLFMKMLRGFPDQMLKKIKHRPSTPLLTMLRKRLKDFRQADYDIGQVKAEYVRMRLPEEAQLVGMKAKVNNYWLFPILVESPDTILSCLNALGVDAYRGATQLNIVEPEQGSGTDQVSQLDPRYPTEARYLIDHVIYLPVHKKVPFHALNKICKAVSQAIKMSKDSPKVRLESKL
ncbi:uncharacterized protein LOC123538678 [Mercenaria mercenaria]|uniref:uncharacterized protein LOC123538678 n=1 Tax=Mercenaria mercenaria TaxID=6596 RepID=UPI00234E439A|nr:uncharacterized protein LOC123538678 [Mercenaria mercenaria]XP_045178902.2 uncharacterized protein LOC123538678 [Mercenaria mercenaria]